MRARSHALLAVTFALGLSTTEVARADVAPPPGTTRVDYTFVATGSVKGVVLVAYPMIGAGSNGRTVELSLDEPARPMQGYTPGIYSLSAADAKALAATEDQKVGEDLLAKKAHLCVKAVPRVFAVPTTTMVRSISDVFRIDATADACKATFDKTIYGGEGGLKGEGTVDPSGHRLVPAPFSQGLPDVGDMGISLSAQPHALSAAPTSPTSSPSASPAPTPSAQPSAAPTSTQENAAPPRGGCAGCAVSGGGEELGIAAFVAVGLAMASRRRPSRGADRG